MRPQHEHIIGKRHMSNILDGIEAEVREAEQKFPEWPDAIEGGVMIMLEESGEVAKACVDLTWDRCDKEELEEELLQTAAMCVRVLAELADYSD